MVLVSCHFLDLILIDHLANNSNNLNTLLKDSSKLNSIAKIFFREIFSYE